MHVSSAQGAGSGHLGMEGSASCGPSVRRAGNAGQLPLPRAGRETPGGEGQVPLRWVGCSLQKC